MIGAIKRVPLIFEFEIDRSSGTTLVSFLSICRIVFSSFRVARPYEGIFEIN